MSIVKVVNLGGPRPSVWLLNSKKLSIVAYRALDVITDELDMFTKKRLDDLQCIFSVNFI